MIYLGIDPGLDGAAACIWDGEIIFFDTPTLMVAGGKKHKRDYCIASMSDWIGEVAGRSFDRATAALEKSTAMPGQGVTSMFSFGRGRGIWEGILTAKKIPFELVSPQRWKKAMIVDMGRDKDASRLVAIRLFPNAAKDLTLKKHHGRADALLLAEYLRGRMRSNQ